ncbi:hypothetical protein BN77_3368 [Rhizobium mesoamericanum STM3625]|uniref:Uncharacterized protein n=1 Tax=Rhizobium mesoamericanum STM3625 TaxID=1211777 RepID=K0Q1B7_9HYPH|nr:hypothetical protein BN77_3368 [Rhizobium mesoamericanum STM3625]
MFDRTVGKIAAGMTPAAISDHRMSILPSGLWGREAAVKLVAPGASRTSPAALMISGRL